LDSGLLEYDGASLGKRVPGVAKERVVSIFMDFEPLNKKATHCLKTSGTTYPATRRHIQEEQKSRLHRCEKLNTRSLFLVLPKPTSPEREDQSL
jgi:hypothetical protein